MYVCIFLALSTAATVTPKLWLSNFRQVHVCSGDPDPADRFFFIVQFNQTTN